jgi:4'-phosphopantetheinyl transferase EntD
MVESPRTSFAQGIAARFDFLSESVHQAAFPNIQKIIGFYVASVKIIEINAWKNIAVSADLKMPERCRTMLCFF